MQHLLLLHGAIGSSEQLEPLRQSLEGKYTVSLFDFPGHGNNPSFNEFSIALFADSVFRFLEEKQIPQVNIFGYSMGGYVALFLAKQHPEVVDKIATLGTKFHWDAETAAREVKMLQPDVIEQKIPAFAETLQQRHKDWKKVLGNTATMLTAMGGSNPLSLDDYRHISNETLILLGDKDKMVGLDETEAVAQALPNGSMELLMDTGHPIEQVNMDMLAGRLTRFFK